MDDILPDLEHIVLFVDLAVVEVAATAPATVPFVCGSHGGFDNRVGSFFVAAEVNDCKTELGRSIPSLDARVANWSTSCRARSCGTCTLVPDGTETPSPPGNTSLEWGTF